MFGVDDAISKVAGLADSIVRRVWPDATEVEKAKMEQALTSMQNEYNLVLAQLKVNEVEAQHGSVFVAGWRPFIGWGLGISMIFSANYWLFSWVADILGFPIPPIPDTDMAWIVVSGLLGIGGLRSFDKGKGIDTKRVIK